MVRSDLKLSMFQQCAVLSGAVAKYTDLPSFSELSLSIMFRLKSLL